MADDLTLRPASRTFIAGKAGSGKTTFALAAIERAPPPVVVLDTKYDPGIAAWGRHHGVPITMTMPTWSEIDDDLIVRPPPDVMADMEAMDDWCGSAFGCRYIPTFYIDEGYQVQLHNQSGAGVVGLWTRSRAFNFRVMMGAQRPAWISRFILTESDTHYVGHLGDERDRKTLAQALGEPALLERLPFRHFIRCRTGEDFIRIKPLNIDSMRAYRRSEHKPRTDAAPTFSFSKPRWLRRGS